MKHRLDSNPKKGRKEPSYKYMAATRKGRRVKAVLDLKAAYDRVPRDTLMQEIRKRT